MKLKGRPETVSTAVPPQFEMMTGLVAVPIIFLNVMLFVYLNAALKQIRSPGFIPSRAPSTTVADAGITYLQVLQATGPVLVALIFTESETGRTGSMMDSSAHENITISRAANKARERRFFSFITLRSIGTQEHTFCNVIKFQLWQVHLFPLNTSIGM